MKKFHKFTVALASIFILMIFSNVPASASILRSSPTLSAYSAILTQGNKSGQIVITYDVAANSIADSLGISAMKIYKSNGSYVTTIYSSALNGFTTTNDMRHRSSYIYTGTSGTSYYAEVTVFATIDGVTDSRTVTTNTVKAP